MNEEVLVLKTKLERAEALRETLERTHASEMRASTRRAEAAEAEARLLIRESQKNEKEKEAREKTRRAGTYQSTREKSSRKKTSRVCCLEETWTWFRRRVIMKVRARLRKSRKSASLRWTLATTRRKRRRARTKRWTRTADRFARTSRRFSAIARRWRRRNALCVVSHTYRTWSCYRGIHT